MKLSDIMRDIADLLDQQVDDQQGGATNTHLKPVQAPEPELSDEPLMVPPLQQKHELLKKVAGVDNTYGNDQQPDDLDRMKKMAGIVIAGEENDIN
jgi:hypothetical protein